MSMKQPLIYVVDKNKSYQKVVVGCLNALNLFNVKAFDNGEFCFVDHSSPADFIILDYNLGDGNWSGIEFMEEYKRIHTSNTEFLFLSSNCKVEIAVESVRKGAVDYILKSKIGLARLSKQIEGFRSYYKKKTFEKLTRAVILGAILVFSAFTLTMSIIYVSG